MPIGGPTEPQGAACGSGSPHLQRGVMSPPRPAEPGPGLMSVPVRHSRGIMEPDPNAPPFEWSQDGVVFLWLIAFILALVLELQIVAHGNGIDRLLS